MVQDKWWLYRPTVGTSSSAEQELGKLPERVRGEVLSAMNRVARRRDPLPRGCPQRSAIRCFTVPSESTNIQVLWAMLRRHRTLVLLHVATSAELCPRMAAYKLARARLDDVRT